MGNFLNPNKESERINANIGLFKCFDKNPQ